MEVSVELLQQLSQIGYMACFQGSPEAGEEILEAVNLVKPDQAPTLVGLAMGRIAANKPEEAIHILRDRVLKIDPDHLTAKCFLGLALLETGKHSEGESYLKDVIAKGDEDQRSVAMAYLSS